MAGKVVTGTYRTSIRNQLGPEFQFRAHMGTGNHGSPQVDVGASGGTFEYDTGAGGSYITYIHGTEHEVEVDLK